MVFRNSDNKLEVKRIDRKGKERNKERKQKRKKERAWRMVFQDVAKLHKYFNQSIKPYYEIAITYIM